MATVIEKMVVKVVVKMGLWSAIKLRIAGVWGRKKLVFTETSPFNYEIKESANVTKD